MCNASSRASDTSRIHRSALARRPEKACEPSGARAGRAGQRKWTKLEVSIQTQGRRSKRRGRSPPWSPGSRIWAPHARFSFRWVLRPYPVNSGQTFAGSSAWRLCAEWNRHSALRAIWWELSSDFCGVKPLLRIFRAFGELSARIFCARWPPDTRHLAKQTWDVTEVKAPHRVHEITILPLSHRAL